MNENMLPVGTVLRAGAYRIERQISSGGFGNTYVVRNISFDEVYAMKEFFMKGVNLRNGSDVTVSITDNKATFESQRNKFKKEAIRLRKLDNPHIVKVHDLFEENGTVYYTMDYIDGQSLADVIKERGPLKEKEALDIFRQMLDALSVVHGQNPPMLHLDIKPANIMLDKNGNAFLIDFGSSKLIDDDNSGNSTTAFTFTRGYAPSELVDQNKKLLGPWTDLYELGATLYYILTGQQPPIASEILEDGENAFAFPKTVSADTRKLILWLMTPSRANRPKSVREVQERIGILTPEPQEPKQEPEPEPEPKDLETGKGPDEGRDDETIYGNPDESGDEDETILTGNGGGKEPPTIPPHSEEANTDEDSSYKNCIIYVIAAIIGIGIAIVANQLDIFRNSPQLPVEEATDETGYTNSQFPPIIQNLINNMVYVEGGTFTMGATAEQGSEVWDNEKPVHQVTLSSFSIGKYEVTQEEWEAVMGNNPSIFVGKKKPVECVSWDDCQEFIRKLNSITGKNFRLPTEAEWEYAAKGGKNSKGYIYAGGDNIELLAWFDGNSNYKTHDVGSLEPNELSIYDMNGNVGEWCQDWFGWYNSSSQTNSKGPSSGDSRVNRGGDWHWDAWNCRVSVRRSREPSARESYLGLRLAL